MAALGLIVGIWLVAAPSARAQRVMAPLKLSPTAMIAAPAPMLPGIMTAPALMGPTLLAPAPSAPAAFHFTPTIAAVPAAPAPLKLSSVGAAVARFAEIDLKSAPAADVRSGADALMTRALGGEAAAEPAALSVGPLPAPAAALAPYAPGSARAPAAPPRVHLLSKPLQATVELGLFARVFYYALEVGSAILKAALTWHATGSPAAAAAMLVFDLVKAPPSLAATTLAHLNLRYWWMKLTTLKRLADTPGVTRIRVLTTGQAEYSGMLARRKANTGLVFVDSKGALPAEIPGFGAPIAVAGLEGRQLRLTLVRNGASAGVAWTPTLTELLSGTPIPAGVAAVWRGALESGRRKTALGRLFDFKKDKELRVEAYLADGKGGESPLGTIVSGGAVKSLVGLGRWDRAAALFGRRPPARSIPLSDTVVERGGERLVEGALRRAWRRLTGALIVRA